MADFIGYCQEHFRRVLLVAFILKGLAGRTPLFPHARPTEIPIASDP
ncbi:MAG: hypothetical protein ACKOBW_17685 [Planctomycetota bacterium]